MRDELVKRGHFQLDPCNFLPGQADIVAQILAQTLSDGPALARLGPAAPLSSGVPVYLTGPG